MSGSYREITPTSSRVFRSPWIRTFPAEHIHRIELVTKEPCWTLVIVFAAARPWGFWHQGQWIHWRDYVKSAIADRMKSCPD
jgi:hypothetical protein